MEKPGLQQFMHHYFCMSRISVSQSNKITQPAPDTNSC